MDKISLYGAGFIGSHFAGKYPDEVVVMDRNARYSKTDNILYMISTVHNYHPKDLDFHTDIDTNLSHFMSVIEANHEKDFVFNLISTWFVYDGSHIPADEDDKTNQRGFYSITAKAREQMLISYCETFGKKYRILRLGNVIGVGDKKVSRRKNALQHMIKELAQGRDVDYLYEGGAIRDFIDVRDCTSAIKIILEDGGLNEIYNVANGEGINVNDLVDVAHRETAWRSTVKKIPVPEFHKAVQTPKIVLNIKKLKNLGYVKQHDIKTVVKELVHYYENNER